MMTHCFFSAVALAAVLFGPAANAEEFEKHIMTGGPNGTYIQIGRDISKLFANCGQTLTVVESAGSIENILAVRNRRHTQFGIVQSDVLSFLQQYKADDADIQDAISGVGIALPLYNEEIHVLAKRDVTSIADLAGRAVGVGQDQSGTNLTATLVLDALGVVPGDARLEAADVSLESLLVGDIDALFYVAGAPTKLFENPAIDAERFHLLPIDEPEVLQRYVSATIPAGSYPFQDEAIDLAAVKAVLMTYDYDSRKNGYHKASCKAVSDLTSLVLTNLEQLQAEGHAKWSHINLLDVPPGWDVPGCVLDAMVDDYQVACTAAIPQVPAPSDGNGVNVFKDRLGKILKDKKTN